MKRITVVLFLTLLIGAPTHALSPHVFKDGPHFAYPTGGDVRQERAGFGWQLAYEWNDYLSAEAAISRHKDKLDDLHVLPEPIDSTFDLEVVSIALSGRLGYPLGRFYPYMGGGLGYYFMRTGNSRVNRSIRDNPAALPPGVSELRYSADMDNTFAYHLALGIEWMITSKWEIFAEYRRVYLDNEITYRRTETRPPSTVDGVFQRSESRTKEDFPYDHGLFRLGVNYRF